MEEAVDAGHPHPLGRLLDGGGHLAQPQGDVAHDGQEGVEGQPQNHCWLARPQGGDHDDAQQGQGGGGLNEVHHPQDHAPGRAAEIAQQAQGHPDENGDDNGEHHHGQVFHHHGEGHASPPPFRSPLGTTCFWSRSMSPPRRKASRAAGTAPSRIRALLLDCTPW